MSKKSAVLDDTLRDEDSTAAGIDATTAKSDAGRSHLGAAVRRGRLAGESTVTLKTLVTAGVLAALVVTTGVLGWQVHAKSNDVDSMRAADSQRAHAEQVALDYATAAADMDFHDLAAWRSRLTKGTSPELSNRLTQAASSMEQIISPLQWVSTAKPVAAKALSESNGVYSIDCFVSVLTKNNQAPDGIQSTATYQLTIDSRNNWVITDIGGIDSALAPKGSSPQTPQQPK
ncbi:hypothetical protein [Nocardia sp. NPDC059239]|uniref:hypothetical protein n=1 Tax=unclassified Nocardia TaxID=2637762 RepID=UPI0036A66AA9